MSLSKGDLKLVIDVNSFYFETECVEKDFGSHNDPNFHHLFTLHETRM